MKAPCAQYDTTDRGQQQYSICVQVLTLAICPYTGLGGFSGPSQGWVTGKGQSRVYRHWADQRNTTRGNRTRLRTGSGRS